MAGGSWGWVMPSEGLGSSASASNPLESALQIRPVFCAEKTLGGHPMN